MEIRYIFLSLLTSWSVAGCSESSTPQAQQELSITIPGNLSSEVRSLVEVGWPKVKAACPGLDKYADSLEFQWIEDNFSFASSKEVERISIVFEVKDSPPLVIGTVANGNRCFFEISRDGSNLSVPKRVCASICEDREIDISEYEKAL